MRMGVLPLLTGLPVSDFTDRSVPVKDVLVSAERLTEALEAARGPADAARVVLDFLARQLSGRAAPDSRLAACASAAADTAARRVRDLAALAGTGERSLRRLYDREFSALPGESPRRFIRRRHAPA
jgi:hypothetical protein